MRTEYLHRPRLKTRMGLVVTSDTVTTPQGFTHAPGVQELAPDTQQSQGTGLTPVTAPVPVPTLPVVSMEPPVTAANPVDIQPAPAQITQDSGGTRTTIQATIYDETTNQPVFGATVTLLGADGNPESAPVTLNPDSNTFTTWSYSPDEVTVLFQKTGYLDNLIAFNDLAYNPRVTLMPGTSGSGGPASYWWALLLLVPLLLKKKKKGARIGKIEQGDVRTVLLIVGGVLGYSLLMKLLQKLGLSTGPGTASVEAQQTDPGSPWKPAYWHTYSSFSSVITPEQAEEFSQQIHDAFTLFQDDFNAVYGVISQLRTKANVSFLAEMFQQMFGEDLLSFLTNGGGILPWDGLNETHLKTITDYVNNLPAT